MIERYYEVAGHSFGLLMPENSPVWSMLDNYLPFEAAASPATGEKAVFHCGLCRQLPDEPLELYYHDEPDDDDMARIDISRGKDCFVFEMRPFKGSPSVFRLRTSSDFSRGMIQEWDCDGAGRFPIDNSLMLMFALRTASMKTLEMHASVTVKDGRGYLFLGKSGTGKSTHSRMWLENLPGCRLLNDDNPVVRVHEDGSVRVYGSPWSGKTRCYVNEDYPVGAFVQIRQYPSNEITRQNVLDSYVSIYSSCSGLKMDESMKDMMHITIENVIEKIPCWLMKCLPNGDAAKVCSKAVTDGDCCAAE